MKSKGDDLGIHIWNQSITWTNKLEKDNPQYDEDRDYLPMLACTLAFFGIMVDRELFIKYGDAKRSKLIDSAMANIHENMSTYFDSDTYQTVSVWMDQYFNELAQYSGQLVPDEGHSPKGTLLWEYFKLVGARFGSPQLGLELFSKAVPHTMKILKNSQL